MTTSVTLARVRAIRGLLTESMYLLGGKKGNDLGWLGLNDLIILLLMLLIATFSSGAMTASHRIFPIFPPQFV
jgi:hypothetical protein